MRNILKAKNLHVLSSASSVQKSTPYDKLYGMVVLNFFKNPLPMRVMSHRERSQKDMGCSYPSFFVSHPPDKAVLPYREGPQKDMGFWELLHSGKSSNFKIKERNHLSNNKGNLNVLGNLINRGVPDFLVLKSLYLSVQRLADRAALPPSDLQSVYDWDEPKSLNCGSLSRYFLGSALNVPIHPLQQK